MRRLSALLLAASLVQTPVHAQPAPMASPAPTAPLDLAACYAAQNARAPFLGLVAAEQGATHFLQTAGRVGAGAPTRATQYRLASVGKVFTQVALGRLIDQGKIRLDAPIGTYLPELPPAFAAITVEQLVHHRGGVAHGLRIDPQSVAILRAAHSAHDLLPLVVNEPLAFPPGSQTQYSNGGYYLLGAVIEAVAHKTYGEYLQSELFGPLGMTRTGMVAGPETAMSLSMMAPPGAPPPSEPGPMRGFPDLPATPAGDAVSTADDLLRLGRALNGGQFVTRATLEQIFPRRAGVWGLGQAGGRPGANTWFMALPDRGATLVVLTNYDPPAGELMGQVLTARLNGEPCHPLSAAERPGPLIIRRPGAPPPRP
jgi:D-alanyl-D-alanine carboxypeptidase